MSKQMKKSLIITRSKCKSSLKSGKLNEIMKELTTSNKESINFCTKLKNLKKQSGMRNSRASIAKKLEIKNCKRLPRLPDNYKKMTWKKLHDTILAIQNSKPIQYPLEELYQTVQNLCEHKMGDTIYEKLKNLVETYISVTIIPFLKETEDLYSYINQVNDWWLTYCSQMMMIRSIFLYLDRTFVLQNPGLLSISELGVSIFNTHIIYNPCVQLKTEQGILILIKQEREGNPVDRPLTKSLIKMIVDLNLYKSKFEEKYLIETSQFYFDEGCRLIKELNIPSYLKHVNQRLKDEGIRISYYFDSATLSKTIQIVVKQLLGDHVQTIITTGLEPLLEGNEINDLSLMYDLCNSVKNGSTQLCSHFNLYIKNKGRAIISATELEIIQNILDLKDKIDNILNTSFQQNQKYVASVKEAFEYFINHRPNKPAELLAKFVDMQLRAGNKKSTDDELEKLLDKIMVLFRFIHSKDVFEAFYKRYLAKRLLVGKSASVDAEKNMLCKLKQECGGGFTSKLEGMFKDMELSKDINITFKQHLNNILNNEQTMDLTVNILTMGFWPTYPVFEVTLPDNMGQYQNFFNNFYLSKHSGRKLQWQSKLGHCVLQSWFPLGNKELQVSLFQTLVLLLFNNSDYLLFEDIKQACNMEEKELRRTLQSLACGKARVLKKLPKGKEVADTDRFHYNFDFTNKYFRIKINQVQMKETPEEQKTTEERVFQDRQYQIDAAIVRIMKMKKTLSHNLLISELYEKLKFPIKPQDLKKRIESLIDQEYIERDKENSEHYHYVA